MVASRYVEGGGLGDWAASRVAISDFATRLSRLVLKSHLSDPMSGFFMISRPAFEGSMRNLSAIGFKILVDLFASAPKPLRYKELPFVFRRRLHGESKLDSMVALEFLLLLLDKMFGIANFAFEREWTWWVSGLVGAVVGAVWNYAVSSVVTWRKK